VPIASSAILAGRGRPGGSRAEQPVLLVRGVEHIAEADRWELVGEMPQGAQRLCQARVVLSGAAPAGGRKRVRWEGFCDGIAADGLEGRDRGPRVRAGG
jgi:hypothetical protein